MGTRLCEVRQTEPLRRGTPTHAEQTNQNQTHEQQKPAKGHKRQMSQPMSRDNVLKPNNLEQTNKDFSCNRLSVHQPPERQLRICKWSSTLPMRTPVRRLRCTKTCRLLRPCVIIFELSRKGGGRQSQWEDMILFAVVGFGAVFVLGSG